jgi:cytoskeletal protein RodZ
MLLVIAPTDDFGLALRATREAAGRTLREMADVTKLGVRTLEALERNQVERLPRGIFRRAVVRAYAKEVGLDPEATLIAFLTRYPDDLPPPGDARGAVVDAAAGAVSWRVAVVVGVLLGLVVALALAVFLLWPRAAAGDAGVRPTSLAPVAAHAPDLPRG